MSRVKKLTVGWVLWIGLVLLNGAVYEVVDPGFLTRRPLEALPWLVVMAFWLWVASVPAMVIILFIAALKWLFTEKKPDVRGLGYAPPSLGNNQHPKYTITGKRIR